MTLRQIKIHDYVAAVLTASVIVNAANYLFYNPIDFKWFFISAAIPGWFVIWEDYCCIRLKIQCFKDTL